MDEACCNFFKVSGEKKIRRRRKRRWKISGKIANCSMVWLLVVWHLQLYAAQKMLEIPKSLRQWQRWQRQCRDSTLGVCVTLNVNYITRQKLVGKVHIALAGRIYRIRSSSSNNRKRYTICRHYFEIPQHSIAAMRANTHTHALSPVSRAQVSCCSFCLLVADLPVGHRNKNIASECNVRAHARAFDFVVCAILASSFCQSTKRQRCVEFIERKRQQQQHQQRRHRSSDKNI